MSLHTKIVQGGPMSNAIDVAVLTGQARRMLRRWVFSISVLFSAGSFGAEFPADWCFVTLKTAHFDVIVNAEQQELGRFYANRFEQAYVLLRPVFTDLPERTIVVLADKTDLTNGYATRLPYSHIFVYPVLPGPQDSLSESGDWGLELATHEFTHILTFEAVSGAAETLQSIFGTILSPNLLLPRWWKEGVAVQMETQLSNGGRLRSAYQDGVIRALENESLLDSFDIAQINEILPDWPLGLRPYMFGSLFWSEAVAKNPGAVDRLHQRHGGRVPYFVNAPARDVLGDDYETVYREAIDGTRRRARAQINELGALGPTAFTELGFESRSTQGPQISPDGSMIAMISVDERGRRSVRVFSRSRTTNTFVDGLEIETFVNRREEDVQPATKDGPPTGTISRLSWTPDGKRVVFDKVDAVSRYETRSDLWIFDIETGESERLTTGLRGREPFAARDGRTVYFTGLDGGRTWLGRFDLATKAHAKIWTAEPQARISFPAELPDGRVVFALRAPAGGESLFVVDPARAENAPEKILPDYPDARFPFPTKDGLLFTSVKNGVHDVYRADASLMKARPATHSIGGVYSTAADPLTGDLYATTMTGRGPFVMQVPKKEVDRIEAAGALPRVDALFADRYPRRDEPVVPDASFETEDYRPSSYLRPRYWLPMFELSAVNDSVILQASTSGFDPLKKHEYALAASWDAGLQEAGYAVAYENNVWPHTLSLTASRRTSYLISTENPIIDDAASVSVVPDVFRISRYASAAVGWQRLRTDFAGAIAERTGPSAVVQYANYGRTGEQISPEDGGSALLGIVENIPGANRLDYTQYLAAGQFFTAWKLPKRHAIALRGSVAYVPDRLPAAYGVQSTNFFFQPDSPSPVFAVRGYRVGHFFGKSLATATAEYRFPFREIRKGRGMDPFFLTRVHGAAFVDAAVVDGFAYRPEDGLFDAVSTDHPFSSFGGELRFETTIGYILPLNFIFGFAVPSETKYGGGLGASLALQMGALF